MLRIQGGLGEEIESLEGRICVDDATLLARYKAAVGGYENLVEIVIKTCRWKEPLEEGEATADADDRGYLQTRSFCCVYNSPFHGVFSPCIFEALPKHAAFNFPGQDERAGIDCVSLLMSLMPVLVECRTE